MSTNFLSFLGRRDPPAQDEEGNSETKTANPAGAATEGNVAAQIEESDKSNEESSTESKSEADEASEVSKTSIDTAAAFDEEVRRRMLDFLKKYN